MLTYLVQFLLCTSERFIGLRTEVTVIAILMSSYSQLSNSGSRILGLRPLSFIAMSLHQVQSNRSS